MTLTASPADIIVGPHGGRRYSEGDGLDLEQPLVWTVPGVLSPDAGAALIARIDGLGFAPAPITTSVGFVMRPDIRNNTRVIFDDAPLAAALFERVRPHVPAEMCGGRRPVGANERFRAYRYEPGQRFAPHFDGAYVRDRREASLLTFMVYLNEGFGGGETDFLDLASSVVPRTGTALLFQHGLLHEGCRVTSGVKYVLRTDVMYRR